MATSLKKNNEVPKDKLTLTPMIRHTAYSRQYYGELWAFAEEMFDSFEYWLKAAINKTDLRTQDAPNSTNVFKAALDRLLKRWKIKADDIAPKLTNKQIKRLTKYVNGQFRPLLGKDVEKNTKRLREIVKARYNENMSLIKSIPQVLVSRLTPVLYGAVTNGDVSTVYKQLSVIKGVTKRQVLRIARDQTAKVAEAFNMARQQQLGLEYYMWLTAHDERVSTGFGGHKQLDGKIFRYDKPEAIIDSYGNRGHPGQRVNCRCISRGVFLKPGERIVKAEVGYKIIQAA